MLSRISTRAPGLSLRRMKYCKPLSRVPDVIAGSMSESAGSPPGSGGAIEIEAPSVFGGSVVVDGSPDVAEVSEGSVVEPAVAGVESLDSRVTPDDEVHAATNRHAARPTAVDRIATRRGDGPERAPNMSPRLGPGLERPATLMGIRK